jgi:hypothetical protein
VRVHRVPANADAVRIAAAWAAARLGAATPRSGPGSGADGPD